MIVKIRAKQVPTCEHRGHTIIRYERLMYVDGILKWEDVQYFAAGPPQPEFRLTTQQQKALKALGERTTTVGQAKAPTAKPKAKKHDPYAYSTKVIKARRRAWEQGLRDAGCA